MAVVIGIILFLIVAFTLAWRANANKDKALGTAVPGSVRVESVKSFRVEQTVKRYAEKGWAVTDQSTAKSFGSNAMVTLTFKKG